MTDRPTRRRMMALTAAALTVPLLPGAAMAEPAMGDIVLGNADAKVTVIEYASFTCPHCGAFSINTFPKVKEAYIDSGKIRFILREVYFDRYGLWASMAARCGGEPGFYPMAEQFLSRQKVWLKAAEDQIPAEIKKIARLNGLTDEQFTACLSDGKYAESLVEAYKTSATADEVTSTPTFIIGGEKTTGNLSFEDLSALIDKHL